MTCNNIFYAYTTIISELKNSHNKYLMWEIMKTKYYGAEKRKRVSAGNKTILTFHMNYKITIENMEEWWYQNYKKKALDLELM